MEEKVVDMQKYKEDKLVSGFYVACQKILDTKEVPSLEKLREVK